MQKNLIAAQAVLMTAILASVALPTMAVAQAQASIEASHRIVIAGRQRMLSQRITMAACFVRSDINSEASAQILSDAYDLFAQSQNGLRRGDVELELRREEILSVLVELDAVDIQFNRFAPVILAQISSSAADPADLAALDASSLEFLSTMNGAVNLMAKEYGNILEDLPLIHSITIDVAGRQRMLSQKAAKEFCLIDNAIAPEANMENLADTVRIFSNTLDALIDGFPGLVMAPPNDAVRTKLQEVDVAWLVPSGVLKRVAMGGAISAADRRVIAAQMEIVLVLMDEAVEMYEVGR